MTELKAGMHCWTGSYDDAPWPWLVREVILLEIVPAIPGETSVVWLTEIVDYKNPDSHQKFRAEQAELFQSRTEAQQHYIDAYRQELVSESNKYALEQELARLAAAKDKTHIFEPGEHVFCMDDEQVIEVTVVGADTGMGSQEPLCSVSCIEQESELLEYLNCQHRQQGNQQPSFI